MAKARPDRIAKAGELYANLIQKVWKVKLGIIRSRELAAAEMRCPGRQDFGVNVEYWRKLRWITEGHAKLAFQLCTALIDYLDGDQPLDEQGLWEVVAKALNAEKVLIIVDEFEAILRQIEAKYGKRTQIRETTFAFETARAMKLFD